MRDSPTRELPLKTVYSEQTLACCTEIKLPGQQTSRRLFERPIRKRFTLIELLVVITIIAILASMLLPALANAKNKARILLDVSNYKTLTTILTMYADDNDEYYPYRIRNYPPEIAILAGPWDIRDGLLDYAADTCIWYCPFTATGTIGAESADCTSFFCTGPYCYTSCVIFCGVDVGTGLLAPLHEIENGVDAGPWDGNIRMTDIESDDILAACRAESTGVGTFVFALASTHATEVGNSEGGTSGYADGSALWRKATDDEYGAHLYRVTAGPTHWFW